MSGDAGDELFGGYNRYLLGIKYLKYEKKIPRVLKQIFNKTQEQAEAITRRIHDDGQGVVGSYVHEVAEQKGIETTLLARQDNFPLQVKVKKQWV